MPSIFAKRHSEIMEKFFRSGRSRMFNKERYLCALHRNGYCFSIKILIKQMPSLAEGIQYVGLIRPTQADYEYILTNTKGVIDCFSVGISTLLNLSCNLFKETEINIQILAPELIKVFSSSDAKRPLLEKFKEPGGQKLTFMVPKDFALHTQAESKKNNKELSKGGNKKKLDHSSMLKNTRSPLFRNFNKVLNKNNGISKQFSARKLTQTAEYKDCDVKTSVKCEIQDLTFGFPKGIQFSSQIK